MKMQDVVAIVTGGASGLGAGTARRSWKIARASSSWIATTRRGLRLQRSSATAPGIFNTPMLDNLPENIRASLGAQMPFPNAWDGPLNLPNWRSKSSKTKCSTAKPSASMARLEWAPFRRRA